MLCDVLHTVAKLQGSLQAKELDLATVPVTVKGTITRLVELKEHPGSSTWFKDHTHGKFFQIKQHLEIEILLLVKPMKIILVLRSTVPTSKV